MTDNLPIPIISDKDLDFYEDYLYQEFKPKSNESVTFNTLLKNYTGKTVKIDCSIGNGLQSKTGILTSLGDDFLTIKLPNRHEIIIKLNSIKFITILQNNPKLPHYWYFNTSKKLCQ